MKAAELHKATGINRTYAWQIINGDRNPSLKVALKIYDATGAKFGQLTNLTKSQIKVARQMV